MRLKTSDDNSTKREKKRFIIDFLLLALFRPETEAVFAKSYMVWSFSAYAPTSSLLSCQRDLQEYKVIQIINAALLDHVHGQERTISMQQFVSCYHECREGV